MSGPEFAVRMLKNSRLPSLLVLKVKSLWMLYTDFCISFYFSGINAQKCDSWVIWQIHVWFLKELPNYFPRLHHFCILPGNGWISSSPHAGEHRVLPKLFSLANLAVLWWAHCGFTVHFPTVNSTGRLSLHLFDILTSSLIKYLFISLYTLKLDIYFFFLLFLICLFFTFEIFIQDKILRPCMRSLWFLWFVPCPFI